jgi:hypothetical protein
MPTDLVEKLAKPSTAPEFQREVKKAGGNILWLANDRKRREQFHQFYCKKPEDFSIPYDAVWQEPQANQT